MPALDWTEEEESLVLQLWQSGKTASQISAALPNRSRNAIIGKIHRLDAKGKDVKRRPNPILMHGLSKKIKKEPIEIEPEHEEKNESYCAEPKCYNLRSKGSYCETHAALYYRRPNKNERKETEELPEK